MAPLLGAGGLAVCRPLCLEAAVGLHALVKNANNINAHLERSVEDHMPTDAIPAIAFANAVAPPPKIGTCC